MTITLESVKAQIAKNFKKEKVPKGSPLEFRKISQHVAQSHCKRYNICGIDLKAPYLVWFLSEPPFMIGRADTNPEAKALAQAHADAT